LPNQKVDSNTFTLQQNESISGIIKTVNAKDTSKDIVESSFPDFNYLNDLVSSVNTSNLTKTQIAQTIYQNYLTRFAIDDYRIANDLQIDITEDKFKVNSLELNYIYKYLLNRFGIQARNIYGYVFPIQPFKSTDYKTEKHIWTEFWNGSEWITTDPVWYLSSRGTVYFDNNDFTHISFGNFTSVNDLKNFLSADQLVSVIPISTSAYKENFSDLSINFTNQVFMNRELQATITNTSNTPIALKDISLNLPNHDINVLKDFNNLDIILYPNTTITLAFPLDYDLVLLNETKTAHINVDFGGVETGQTSQTLDSNITIQSNISSYMSILIFGGFILFSLSSIFAVNFYKKRNVNSKA
jgi:hypothetical protein